MGPWKSTSMRPKPTSLDCWSGSPWAKRSSLPRPEHPSPSSFQLSRQIAGSSLDRRREKLSLPMTSAILFRKRSKIFSGNESPTRYPHFYLGAHRRKKTVSKSAPSDRFVRVMVERSELVGGDSKGADRKALRSAASRAFFDWRT